MNDAGFPLCAAHRLAPQLGSRRRSAAQRNATFVLWVYRRHAPHRIAALRSSAHGAATQRNVCFVDFQRPAALRAATQRNSPRRPPPLRNSSHLSAWPRNATFH
jgi:hypothetical protein